MNEINFHKNFILQIPQENKTEVNTKSKIFNTAKTKRSFSEQIQRRAPLPATIAEIKESRTKQNELDFMKLYFEKNISEDFSHERYKIEREICELENKYGKDAVRTFVKKALSDYDEIFKNNMDKAFSVATSARFLAGTKSVSQLFDYETNDINKIISEGKCDFWSILNKLNHIEADNLA